MPGQRRMRLLITLGVTAGILALALAACGGTVSDAGAPDGEAGAPDADVPCIPAVVEVSGHCARKADGTAWCWGWNNIGQVGDGTTEDRSHAVQVTALGTSVAQLADGNQDACARKTDGTLWCWGAFVGDGVAESRRSPVQVTALGTSVADVAASDTHICARKTDGSLWCWGDNSVGELGDGTPMIVRWSPVQVAALGTAVARVFVGLNHTCALKTDGTLWCWGLNGAGELGDPMLPYRNPTPVHLAALEPNVAEVAVGPYFCARKTDGTLWCWGSGLLGDGSLRVDSGPVEVAALGTSVAEVSAGAGQTCARKTDGTLWCWGDNAYGEAGDGTAEQRFSPAQIAQLGTSVAQVSAASDNTCALKTDGSVWCWGENTHGNTGDGTTQGAPCDPYPDAGAVKHCRLVPVKVVGLCP